MHKLLACIFFLLYPKFLLAENNCNFKTANYINELNNSTNINNISIEIPKYRKWVKNSLSILKNNESNISSKYKKNFLGNIKIVYNFGSCDYKAKIRQVGDWKDHIKFNNEGSILSSLNVKLIEGNILNAVSFKLLLPETRNYDNEILGTILLKELGFLVPETFMINGKINGADSVFIFQENIKKEMLERNGRREGPIFEGEEKFLWSYKQYEPFELENISLSRVTNPDWSVSGKSTLNITFKSFQIMQEAYLNYINKNMKDNSLNINPNYENDKLFANYSYALIALGGTHALRPHNRIYYFNSFKDKFEPIYYDGNFDFEKDIYHEMDISQKNLLGSILPSITKEFQSSLNSLINDKESIKFIKQQFKIKTHNILNSKFNVNKALKSIQNNLIKLSFLKDDIGETIISNEKYEKMYERYLKNLLSHDLNLLIAKEIKFDESNVTVKYDDKDITYSVTNNNLKDIKNLISKNNFLDRDAVFLPTSQFNRKDPYTKKIKFLDGSIVMSKNIELIKDIKKKKIDIYQKKDDDWIFFKNLSLNDWDINFHGHKNLNNIQSQKINEYGLTGCLNFYDVLFEYTSLAFNKGNCEDSINIISSHGTINKISIYDSLSDGLDIDFSDIIINKIVINEALNDCADFSYGIYKIEYISVTNCGDKGISIGEKSKSHINISNIKKSNIGISVKDYSTLNLKSFESVDTKFCLEAKQKKQEFGGSKIIVISQNCDSHISLDSNSLIKIKAS